MILDYGASIILSNHHARTEWSWMKRKLLSLLYVRAQKPPEKIFAGFKSLDGQKWYCRAGLHSETIWPHDPRRFDIVPFKEHGRGIRCLAQTLPELIAKWMKWYGVEQWHAFAIDNESRPMIKSARGFMQVDNQLFSKRKMAAGIHGRSLCGIGKTYRATPQIAAQSPNCT